MVYIKKGFPDRKGKNNSMFGKHHSEETKRKIGISNSIANKGRKAWNKGIYGKVHHSEEYKKEISNRMKLNNPAKKIEIKQKISEGVKQAYKDGILNTSKENNAMWLGGKSFEPYSSNFDKKLKNKIKKRDEYMCQICDNKNKQLCIHHIDYNKKNCNFNNLLSLCRNCHIKTNHNREYWQWQLEIFMNLFHNTNNQINFKLNQNKEVNK